MNAHNRLVRSRVRRFVVANSVLLIVASMAASPVADLLASAAAMACCAKTDYSCAGISGPDDCCQHMGHTAHGVAPGTCSSARSADTPTAAIVPAFSTDAAAPASTPFNSVSPFTRPHDPPHLHSYSLLI